MERGEDQGLECTLGQPFLTRVVSCVERQVEEGDLRVIVRQGRSDAVLQPSRAKERINEA